MTVGDINSTEVGSCARYNDDKPPFSLIPLSVLEGTCKVLEYGRKKYAAWNWAKGSQYSVAYDSMMRHMAAWQAGEDVDAESGLNHLDHAMCNMMFLIYYTKHYPELDDRFRPPQLELDFKSDDMMPREEPASHEPAYQNLYNGLIDDA